MSSEDIFPFEKLPTDLQICVMKQLNLSTLINFRKSCRWFHYLTEHYSKRSRPLCDISIEYHIVSKFEKYFYAAVYPNKERRRYAYRQIPTSKFWSNLATINLVFFKVPEIYHVRIIELLKTLKNFNFNSVIFKDVPIDFVLKVMEIIGPVNHIRLLTKWFLMRKFIFTEALKNLRGIVEIGQCNYIDPGINEHIRMATTEDYYESHSSDYISDKNFCINHIFKQLLNGTYAFTEVTIHSESPLKYSEIFHDINYKQLYDKQHHESSIFGFIDRQYLDPINFYVNKAKKTLPLYEAAAIKMESGNILLALMLAKGKIMKVFQCSPHDVIRSLLDYVVNKRRLARYPDYVLQNLYKQKII